MQNLKRQIRLAQSDLARVTRTSTYCRCVALAGYGAIAVATVGSLVTAMTSL